MASKYGRNKRNLLVLLPAIVLLVVILVAQSGAWASPNSQTTVPPAASGTVLLDEYGVDPEALLSGDGDVRIDLPVGAVNNAQADWRTLRYTPKNVGAGWIPPTDAPYQIGHVFSLDVFTWGIVGGGALPLAGYSFLLPIWVQINYTGADTTTAAGRNLQVAYNTGVGAPSPWVLLSNQTYGAGYIKGQITTLAATRQTWFALIAPPTEQTSATVSADSSKYGIVQVGVSATTLANGTTPYALPGAAGLKAYAATASYSATGIEMKQVLGGTAPFDTVTSVIGATQTTFNKSQTASVPVPPVTVATLYPILVGNATTVYNLTIDFTSATDTANAPIDTTGTGTSIVKSFLRGDADKGGTVDIVDALFIAQYLAGNRPIADLNGVNAASPQHDGVSGDKTTIVDALYIAQKQAGLRDSSFAQLF